MMVNFPFIDIPKSFTRLLKTNFKDKRDIQQNLERVLLDNPALKILINNLFSNVNGKVSLANILNSFGWKMIRDKIAMLYLQRFESGKYEISTLEQASIREILDLEDKYFDFATKGISRMFLLGLYLKMAEIDIRKKTGDRNINLIESAIDVLPIIKIRSTKSMRLDWLVLLTWHFQEYFGFKDFEKVLDENDCDYFNVYNKVDDNFKEIMMGNLVTYGTSIYDKYVIFNGLES